MTTEQSKPTTRDKFLEIFNTPEARARYKAAIEKWHKKYKPLIDANRQAEQITGDDLNIRVGPCK